MNAIQLDEIFDEIGKQPTVESRRDRFRQFIKTDKSVTPYLQMAFDPNEKITGLPEGYPEGPNGRILIDKDIPAGMGFTCLRLEVRRFKMFGPNGSAQKITQSKREYAWAREIEGLHWKEAELITDIKDGTLLSKYPFLLEVLDIVHLSVPDPSEPTV